MDNLLAKVIKTTHFMMKNEFKVFVWIDILNQTRDELKRKIDPWSVYTNKKLLISNFYPENNFSKLA